MPRQRFLDVMQNYPFWVFDASGFAGNPLFSILDPTLGFSACTTPEISLELKEIQPGNWEYKRRAVKTADVSAITLTRGARFYDADFFVWITNATRGHQPLRRNLVLVHFMTYRPLRALVPPPPGQTAAPTEIGINSLVERLPGRAWFLRGCLPVRYKPASDFDAASSDVSVQELDVQPEDVIELSVATASPTTARSFSLSVGVATAAERAGKLIGSAVEQRNNIP